MRGITIIVFLLFFFFFLNRFSFNDFNVYLYVTHDNMLLIFYHTSAKVVSSYEISYEINIKIFRTAV